MKTKHIKYLAIALEDIKTSILDYNDNEYSPVVFDKEEIMECQPSVDSLQRCLYKNYVPAITSEQYRIVRRTTTTKLENLTHLDVLVEILRYEVGEDTSENTLIEEISCWLNSKGVVVF